MIIALIGYALAGKDEISKYLCLKYGFQHFNFSDVIVDELEKRDLNDTKENRSLVGTALRKETGDQGIIGRMLARKLKSSHWQNIVLTGMRSPEELIILREVYGSVFAVYIEASLAIRLVRRGDTTSLDEDIKARDERDRKSMGLGMLIDDELYDYKVINEGTVLDLHTAIDTLMQNLQ